MSPEDHAPDTERLPGIGLILVFLGFVAVLAPALAGTVVSLLVGLALLAAGLAKGYRVVRRGSWWEQREDALLAVLAVLVGIVIVIRPIVGLAAITVALAVYFVSSAVVQGLWWWRSRHRRGSIWLLVSGIATTILAILIATGWPLSGLWAVGALVGLHLIFSGASIFAFSCPPTTREAAESAAKADAAAA
jgi:uncharacterized membrane protein HdeD (DUF308 family)